MNAILQPFLEVPEWIKVRTELSWSVSHGCAEALMLSLHLSTFDNFTYTEEKGWGTPTRHRSQKAVRAKTVVLSELKGE